MAKRRRRTTTCTLCKEQRPKMYLGLKVCHQCFRHFLDAHFSVPSSDFALKTGRILIEELLKNKKHLGAPYRPKGGS